MKKKLIAIASVSLSVIFGATGCGNSGVQAANAQEAAEGADGVRKVVVAHTQAYAPYDFIDENGESDGYEVAVLKAVDELLADYEFEYVGTTDDDLLIGVESGKYQIGTKGIWWTAPRSESYVFPEHYIGSSITGLTFKSEYADQIKDMESFAEFSGRLVPLAPQNAQYTIVENYNKANPDKQVVLIAAEQFSNTDSYQWVLP